MYTHIHPHTCSHSLLYPCIVVMHNDIHNYVYMHNIKILPTVLPQTAQIKQQVQSKLEQRLVEKETELLMVRGQLDEVGVASGCG